VKILLKDPRIDVSVNENSAFRISAIHGRTEIVNLLLKGNNNFIIYVCLF